MGTIRILLAFAVIFSHTGSHALVGGEAALQCFYLISGFLISYILRNTAAYGNLRNFYLNRFLRIYPMYWAVALLTVMFYLLAFTLGIDHKLQTLLSLPLSAQLTLITTNIVLFGQDAIMFMGLRENGLVFFLDYRASSPQLWTFLLVPQACSLSVELTFYLCAPFILKNRTVLWTCLALSLIARGAAMMAGFGLADPWSYRFFPFELSLFLFGALAQQILLPRVERLCDAVPRLETVAVAVLLVMIVAFPLDGHYYLLKKGLLLLVFVLALPFLFLFQKRNSWDRTIGELSYPVYICHWLMILILKYGLKMFHMELPAAPLSTFSVIGLSVIFSIGLNSYVAEPMDRLRKAIRDRGSKQQAAADRSGKLNEDVRKAA
jgi:peptidoglycan/LPS O-acetylase OafA/YrhL